MTGIGTDIERFLPLGGWRQIDMGVRISVIITARPEEVVHQFFTYTLCKYSVAEDYTNDE